MEDRFLNPEEAAEYLGISRRAYLVKVRKGEIRSTKIGKLPMAKKAWLEEYATGEPTSAIQSDTRSEARKKADDDIAEAEGAEAKEKKALHEANIEGIAGIREKEQELEDAKIATLEEQSKAQEAIAKAQEIIAEEQDKTKRATQACEAAEKIRQTAQTIIDRQDKVQKKAMDEDEGLKNLVEALNEHCKIAEAIHRQGVRWGDEYLANCGNLLIKSHNILCGEYNDGGDHQVIANAVCTNCRKAIKTMGEYQDDKKMVDKITTLSNLVCAATDKIEGFLHRKINPVIRDEEEEEEEREELEKADTELIELTG